MIEKLVRHSLLEVERGIYNVDNSAKQSETDFNQIKRQKGATIIAEIKFASPSHYMIRKIEDPASISREMVNGGAAALSVLTQPYKFRGSLKYFTKVRKATSIPMLMKDIIVDPIQIKTAGDIGADCILLIQTIFDKKYISNDINEFIEIAHNNNIRVLLEVHNGKELKRAIATKCDIIGINNRNLDTLETSLNVTKSVLDGYADNRLIISESGIREPKDIQYLRDCGADAFLIGTSIMEKDNIRNSVQKLVHSI